jgi:malate synthase
VTVARQVFDKHMPTPNQISTAPGLAGSRITEADLLQLPTDIPPSESVTSDGLQRGVAIVLAYTEAWLRGVGCIPLHNAMEDAATAEISRAQIWQWRVNGVPTQDDGQIVTSNRISDLVAHEVNRQCGGTSKGKWKLAGRLVSCFCIRVSYL